MEFVFLLTALVCLLSVLLIFLFLLLRTWSALSQIGVVNFLTTTTWKPLAGLYGILPMIVASIYVTVGAIILAVPLGISSAVFLVKFCPKKIYSFIKLLVDLMAGIPSIVYGFFALVAIVPLVQRFFATSGKGILTASIILAIMILPTIIIISESALLAVPVEYYENSLALGATPEQSMAKVMLPAAKSGIFAGVVLAASRAIGETMAVVMIAGNQAILPTSILDGARTLTANIALEMSYASGLHQDALISSGMVLFILILLINLCFSQLRKTKVK